MLAKFFGMRFSSFWIVPGRMLVALLACSSVNVVRAQDVSFLPAVSLSTGNSPEAIAVGNLRDFQGDSVLDLAVVNGASNSVSVLLGNGDGTFQDPVSYGVGTYPWYVTVADLNGDRFPDLVVSNYVSSDLTVLLGMGGGTFVVAGTIPLSETPFSVVANDFNSDGVQDLVVTNLTSTFLLLGNGDGTFGQPVQLNAGDNTQFVAVGDFNRDGIPDLAVTNSRGTDTVTVLLGHDDGTGHGDGTFDRVPPSFPVG